MRVLDEKGDIGVGDGVSEDAHVVGHTVLDDEDLGVGAPAEASDGDTAGGAVPHPVEGAASWNVDPGALLRQGLEGARPGAVPEALTIDQRRILGLVSAGGALRLHDRFEGGIDNGKGVHVLICLVLLEPAVRGGLWGILGARRGRRQLNRDAGNPGCPGESQCQCP